MSFLAAVAAAQKTARQLTSNGEIIYARGAVSVDLTAGRGRSSFDVLQGDVLVHLESRDFLIEAAELVLDGALTLPVRGDRITETDELGATLTYEVLEPGGEPPWRYSDEYRLQFRVHTKLIANP